MGYPDNFSSLLFDRHTRDRIEPRDLTRDEKIDIAALRDAIAIAEDAASKLRAIERYVETDHTPNDVAREIDWNISRLNESIQEITRQPEIEAERADLERDA